MSSDDRSRFLSEEDAKRIWRRAAELQAEAARTLEERSRSLADEGEPEGYSLEHVRSAAVEAGIAEEFVGQALAEAEGEARTGRRLTERLAVPFLGDRRRDLRVSRVFDASPGTVYDALQEILPAPPFELELRESRGGHPLEGGVLVFDVPVDISQVRMADLDSSFAFEMRGWADTKEIHVSLRPVGEEGHRTELTVRAPLDRARAINVWLAGPVVGGGSLAVGAVTAAAVGAAVGAGAPLLALLGSGVAAAASFGVSGFIGTHLWRVLYRWGIGRGEKQLRRILERTSVHLTTGGAFTPGGGGRAPPGSRDAE